jgi:hypothetical protein
MAVFEHVLDPEIFNSNESVALNVVPSRLVGVILTLAGDLEVLLGGPLKTAGVLDGLPFGI